MSSVNDENAYVWRTEHGATYFAFELGDGTVPLYTRIQLKRSLPCRAIALVWTGMVKIV